MKNDGGYILVIEEVKNTNKYPINKEFFPFSHFTPPINEKFLAMAAPNMKTPKFIFKDKELDVVRYEVESYDGEKIEVFLMAPKAFGKKLPCLVYFHGGGFVLTRTFRTIRVK